MRQILFTSLLLLTGLIPYPACAERPLEVFVSVLPLQQLVERVAGDAAHVQVLVGPGQSPHNYEPTPRQIAGLAHADLLLRIGVPYEDAWLGRITAANPRLRVVDGREGMPLHPGVEHGHAHGHDHAPGHDEAMDPHIWTDPQRLRILVGHLADWLTELRPALGATFHANASRLDNELAELDHSLRATLACLQDRRFLVFHPAWGYFAERYDLEQVSIEVEGKEPNARALAEVIDAARAQGMRRVLVQPQFSRRGATAVATALHGELVVADPLAPDMPETLRQLARLLAAGCAP